MTVTCPVPLRSGDRIQLGHGGGGRWMADLIQSVFLPAFGAPGSSLHDGAALPATPHRTALSTDAYVVRPLFFPGGDIGTLAVHGTVNDLAMCGARSAALTAAFVLEEGLPVADLQRVVASMAAAAGATGARIVAGDTKVVEHGKADGLYITTAGVGTIPDGVAIAPERIAPGDAILVSGDLGRHGIAILAQREGLTFDTTLESDCGDVSHLVEALVDARVDVHCARDLTRGGLSSALVELATAAKVRIDLDETEIPVHEQVRGACEMLGLDPLYVACEGRFCALVPEAQAESALRVLRAHPAGAGARRIGRVAGSESDGLVVARGPFGAERVVDLFSGEQLPRIC